MEYASVRFFDDKWASGTNFRVSILLMLHTFYRLRSVCMALSRLDSFGNVFGCARRPRRSVEKHFLHKVINVCVLKCENHHQNQPRKGHVGQGMSEASRAENDLNVDICLPFFLLAVFVAGIGERSPSQFMDTIKSNHSAFIFMDLFSPDTNRIGFALLGEIVKWILDVRIFHANH